MLAHMGAADDVDEVVTGADGRRVGYLARGPRAGRPVLYLHGAPGSRREQRILPDQVLRRFGVRLVSVDRAGYGATDPLPGGRPTRVRDVLTVCDALGIDGFPLVAVSSGGSYAITLAALEPDRVDRVVLSSAQMPYDDDNALGDLQPDQRSELAALRAGRSPDLEREYEEARSALLADVLDGMAGPMATLSRREQDWFAQPWVQQVLVEDVEEGVRASIEGYLEDGLSVVRPLEVDVTSVRAPVRAVHGSIDDWEPLDNLRRTLAGLADVQLFVLDGLNHFGPLLYPDLLVSLAVGDR